MNDLISRQAVKEWLAKWEGYIDADTIARMQYRVIDIPSAQPEWIPCSERLPQPNEEAADGFIKAYLVQDGRWMDVARWNGDCWIAWGYGTALTNVVAWMPLPEPYREEGD